MQPCPESGRWVSTAFDRFEYDTSTGNSMIPNAAYVVMGGASGSDGISGESVAHVA